MLRTKFWKRAAAKLPASVRDRNIDYLARAERVEILVDGVLGAWSRIRGLTSKHSH